MRKKCCCSQLLRSFLFLLSTNCPEFNVKDVKEQGSKIFMAHSDANRTFTFFGPLFFRSQPAYLGVSACLRFVRANILCAQAQTKYSIWRIDFHFVRAIECLWANGHTFHSSYYYIGILNLGHHHYFILLLAHFCHAGKSVHHGRNAFPFQLLFVTIVLRGSVGIRPIYVCRASSR